ncbi:MAG: hypothetical protein KGK10_06785 [Rhodospirillales bacterium]|nr:hypothetical protein [Rhodospirillales bacterium]
MPPPLPLAPTCAPDGWSLLEAGRIEEALAAAQTALALDPEQTLAALVRARALQALGRFEQAAAAFARVDALWPRRAGILASRAQCLAEADRLVEAEACLRAALALAPDAAIEANLGAVLARLERGEEAGRHLRSALRRAPDLREAHRNLAALLAYTDPAAAGRHRDAAYRGRPVLVRAAARPRRRVLVLASAEAANVPLRHLLGRDETTLIEWYVDYADTGAPPEACDVAFNAIGDPDLARPLPAMVRGWLAARGMRLLNAPAAVARTRRDRLGPLLAGIDGVVVPPVLRHRAADGRAAAALARAGLDFPVLVRPFASHGGAGVRRITQAGELPETDAYLTSFVDYAGADGWFRKYRAIFVGGMAYPYHLAISRHWMVHYWTAGMETDPIRRAEEQRFLAAPEQALGAVAARALAAIGRRLGLDFAGIDFSVLPDGRLLVFEANAPMLVHPEPGAMFSYRNDAVARIRAAFAALLDRAARSRGPS